MCDPIVNYSDHSHFCKRHHNNSLKHKKELKEVGNDEDSKQ